MCEAAEIHDDVAIILSIFTTTLNFLSLYYFYQHQIIIFILFALYFLIVSVVWINMLFNHSKVQLSLNISSLRCVILYIFLRPFIPTLLYLFNNNPKQFEEITNGIITLFHFDPSIIKNNHKYFTNYDIFANGYRSFHSYCKYKMECYKDMFFLQTVIEAIPCSVFQVILISYYHEYNVILFSSVMVSILFVISNTIIFTHSTTPLLHIIFILTYLIDYIHGLTMYLWIFHDPYWNQYYGFFGDKCNVELSQDTNIYHWMSKLFVYRFTLNFIVALVLTVIIWICDEEFSCLHKWIDFRAINLTSKCRIFWGLLINFIIFLIKSSCIIICAIPIAIFFGDLTNTFWIWLWLSNDVVHLHKYFIDFPIWIDIFEWINKAHNYRTQFIKSMVCIDNNGINNDLMKRLCIVNYLLSGKGGHLNQNLLDYLEQNESSSYNNVPSLDLLRKNNIFDSYNNWKWEFDQQCNCCGAFWLIVCILIKVIGLFLPLYGLIWYYFSSEMNVGNINWIILRIHLLFGILSNLLIFTLILLLLYLCWFVYVAFHIIPLHETTNWDSLNSDKFVALCNYLYYHLPDTLEIIKPDLTDNVGIDLANIILEYVSNGLDENWRKCWLDYPKNIKGDTHDEIGKDVYQLLHNGNIVDLKVNNDQQNNV